MTVALLVAACAGAAPVAAAPAGELGIARFAVQTTRVEPAPRGPGPNGYGFENQPYAFTQAGGHPQALTSTIAFTGEAAAGGELLPTRDPRDLLIELPAGVLAEPQSSPRCPPQEAFAGPMKCPRDTQVGTFAIQLAGGKAEIGPIVDIVPEAGEPAELGLEAEGAILPLAGRLVRTPAGYALALVARGLPLLGVLSVEATLWGTPADPVHDPQRGLTCAEIGSEWLCEGGGGSSGAPQAPFLTLGSDCAAGPLDAVAYADSWEQPQAWTQARATLPRLGGCDLLSFAPTLEVQPETPLADEATAVGVALSTPQPQAPQALGVPPLRQASVTLPQGVSLSPAFAGGVQACPASGPEGIGVPTGVDAAGQPLSPEEAGAGEELGPDGLKRLAPGRCPQASRAGSAEASTPLLAAPLRGGVYLAQPLCGGAGQAACTAADAADGGLFRVYLELASAGEPGAEGVRPPPAQSAPALVVKLAGHVDVDPATGQLTVRIAEAPQLPLSRLTISLAGGPHALLANPVSCTVGATATTTSDLTPWSAPGVTPEGLLVSGTPDATPSSFYELSGCSARPAFGPQLLAGTLSSTAGAFSPLTLTVSRSDREQPLSQIQAKAPPGLFAKLAGVELCGAAQAAAGAGAGGCPIRSRIGDSAILVGAGSAPLEVPGAVYLTGPYRGAPFGLAMETRMRIGPFDLGTLTVRAAVSVDPATGALTITSDPLPQILDGVPLRVKRLTIDIDRPGFVFNPTSCAAKRIDASVLSAQGALARVFSPFAAGGCRALSFAPRVGAAAKAHRRAGASLDVRLSVPAAAQGTQANLARLSVTLPRQLPSRLVTLQHACPGRTFARDPAACLGASVLGIVKVSTPELSAPLVGPVYFVSRGVSGPPAIVVVLQGEGIEVRLTGKTRVAGGGAIAVDFPALPDVPLGRAELYLPAGPHSALGAARGLCAKTKLVTVRRIGAQRIGGRIVKRSVQVRERVRAPLIMPVELTAQNGAVVRRDVKVRLAGCPRWSPRS